MAGDDGDVILKAATGRTTVPEALAWIAEGHRLRPHVATHDLLRAVLSHSPRDQLTEESIRRLTLLVAKSDLDSASLLFHPDIAIPAMRFRRALDMLAHKSPTGSLVGLTRSAVRAAQREDAFVVETVCALAGLTYKGMRERLGDDELPAAWDSAWSPSQIDRVFQEVDHIVEGRQEVNVPDATPSRPFELIPSLSGLSQGSGWELLEQLRQGGVPYEVLLGQRAAGGAWLAHRQRTSSSLNRSVATLVCDELDRRRIDYVLASQLGGDARPTDLQSLSYGGNEIGLVIRATERRPAYAVAFASARDGGTARRSIDNLLNMRQPRTPVGIVLSGLGFAQRNETAELAARFDGRIFSDQTVDLLADDIESVLATFATEENRS